MKNATTVTTRKKQPQLRHFLGSVRCKNGGVHRTVARIVAFFILLVPSSSSPRVQSETETCLASDRAAGTCTTAADVSAASSLSSSSTPSVHSPDCGLYMAPSTIPGAGIGIFTAVAKRVGDKIGRGDVCIPVIDMYWHNRNDDAEQPGKSFFNPFNDYFWKGKVMGMHEETVRDDIEAYCPGLDCAINCHLALVNVEKAVPVYDDGSFRPHHHDTNMHRDKDPGVGAFTPYHNGTTTVTRDIPAGGELFKHYGDSWFVDRVREFGRIPLTDDYAAAETLLASLVVIKEKLDHIPKQSDNERNQEVTTSDEILQDLYKKLLIQTYKGRWDSRILNALPDTWKDAVTAAEAEELAVLLQPKHTVTVEYLKQHGTCIDHIQPGWSTLPQAGRGAFAVRNLPANTVITASPLHHLPSYTFMTMYNFTKVDDTWYRLIDEVETFQLFYNYCYGHADSSILLCPYGSGVNYINHNKSQVNVRMEWAESFDIVHNHTAVEKGTVLDLAASTRPQLAMQYVAITDIRAGDELFLDYGEDWETAWLEHVADYKGGPQRSQKYVSAHYWNHEFKQTAIRTVEQQEIDPYPANLQTRCHWLLLTQSTVNMTFVYRWTDKDYGMACRILDRFWEGYTELYTIQLEWRPDEEDEDDFDLIRKENELQASSRTVVWMERTDVPRSAIRFFDLPYTTDLHMSTAFRHEIGIPDEIFPEQWRNL